MKKRFIFAISLLLSCFITTSMADQTAIAEDGRKVLLKDDGTWEYMQTKAAAKNAFHFRKTRWGMTREEVTKSEADKLYGTQDFGFIYESRLLDLDCWTAYIFVQDRLIRTKYVVTEDHTNKNDYILDYNRFKTALTKKYGEPVSDRQDWRNDLFKDDYSQQGLAISIGHLRFSASWVTPKTTVFLSLNGDKHKVDLQVEYSSQELKILEEQANEQKILDDL